MIVMIETKMMIMLMTVLLIMRIVAMTPDHLLSNLANSQSFACALPTMCHIIVIIIAVKIVVIVVIIILEKQGCAVVA